MKKYTCTILFLLVMLLEPLHLEAQEKLPVIPPAKVVVSNVTSGFIAPEGEFIGTVYYQEVSDVASEVRAIFLFYFIIIRISNYSNFYIKII